MKNTAPQKNTGFSSVELVIAIVVFTIATYGISLFMIDILDSSERAQNLDQAVLLAEEGIEAVKSIRDNDDDGLFGIADGEYGIELQDDGEIEEWALDVEPDLVDIGPGYTRTITLTEISGEEEPALETMIKLVESKITWPRRITEGEVKLYTHVTNWNKEFPEPEPEPEPEP